LELVKPKADKEEVKKADDVMAFLESMAPSVKKISEEFEEKKSSHKKSRNRSRYQSDSFLL
jgi:hypothetical protein